MNRNPLQDYFNNPELYRKLAERERARAVGESLSRLMQRIRGLAGRVADVFSPRHPARWVERLG